jgi:ATP-binding cassette subfamily F protein uup
MPVATILRPSVVMVEISRGLGPTRYPGDGIAAGDTGGNYPPVAFVRPLQYFRRMALLSLRNVNLSFGGLPLLDGVDLHIERGDRVCLLGANGSGKSSLLRILSGESPPDSGEVVRSSRLRVTRLAQQVPSHLHGRVMDVVAPGVSLRDGEPEGLAARQILTRLGLDPDAEFGSLSGGTRRRVLLAHALMGSPDVVLLDEPTNHLDMDSIAWLEGYLLRHCRTFLFVTHDRTFLRRLASRVVELDRGRLSDWACDYDTFLRRKAEQSQAEESEWQDMDRRLRKEEAWLRRGVRARAVRNMGRLHALQALRAERRSRREHAGSVRMAVQEAGRTGHVVVKAENLSFGFGPQPLIREFATVVTRGDRVGILGPNGCGKTTLLRLLLNPAGTDGGLSPQAGRIVHGTNLRIAYADQLRAQLDEDRSLAENVAQGREFVTIEGGRRHIHGYLADFLFAPDRVNQPVGSLSGGERNRLLLARLFAEPSNVLVLDEPTNDLDLDTLELLEEQLAVYRGTVLLVSHDRAFLNNVVTSVLAFEKHSPEPPFRWLGADDGWYVNEYVGGHDDWAARRVLPPAPAEAASPTPAHHPRQAGLAIRRLTHAEKRLLESLPGRIEAMEEEQAQWHGSMADAAFYRRPREEIARARQRSAELAAEIANAYRSWEDLEAVLSQADA